MAARKTLKHSEDVRARIQTSQLINRLNGFALSQPDPQTGEPIAMTDTQVRAALGLLKKTVADLSQVTGTLDVTHRDANELSDAELTHIAAAGSARASAPPRRPNGPDQVH